MHEPVYANMWLTDVTVSFRFANLCKTKKESVEEMTHIPCEVLVVQLLIAFFWRLSFSEVQFCFLRAQLLIQ